LQQQPVSQQQQQQEGSQQQQQQQQQQQHPNAASIPAQACQVGGLLLQLSSCVEICGYKTPLHWPRTTPLQQVHISRGSISLSPCPPCSVRDIKVVADRLSEICVRRVC
jgi:hypothetical protein